MSTPPNSSTAVLVIALTSFALLTSTARPRARPFERMISEATPWAACGSMSATTVLAPASAMAIAAARPIPAPPPVTMATLPARSMAPTLCGRWPQANQHLAFSGQVIVVVVEARRVREQKVEILHVLREPVSRRQVAEGHRAGGDVVHDGVAVGYAAVRLHVLVELISTLPVELGAAACDEEGQARVRVFRTQLISRVEDRHVCVVPLLRKEAVAVEHRLEPGQEVGVVENVVAIQQVLVIGVDRRLRADRHSAQPSAGLYVESGGDEIDRRAAVVNSLRGPLRDLVVAVIARQLAEHAELRQVRSDLGDIVGRLAHRA